MDIKITGSKYFDSVTIANLGTVGTFFAEEPENEIHVLPVSTPPPQLVFTDDGQGNITISYS